MASVADGFNDLTPVGHLVSIIQINGLGSISRKTVFEYKKCTPAEILFTDTIHTYLQADESLKARLVQKASNSR